MNGEEAPEPELRPSGRVSCPITSAQQLAFDVHEHDPSNGVLACKWRLLLEGPLDRDVLARCLDDLLARHVVLGSRFAEVGGRVHQFIPTRRHTFELEHVSFEDVSETAQPARWRAVFDRLASPFDLGVGPLMRCALVRLAPDRHVLALVNHHIAFDDGSCTGFMSELERGYLACSTDEPWPEPELQYIDLAAYLDALERSTRGAKQRAFWAEQLAGAEPVELPIDRSRSILDDRRDAHPRGIAPMPAAEIATIIEPPLHAAIAALARTERASPYIVLLASLTTAIHRARAQRYLTYQSRYSFRGRPELADLLGYVSNATLVRIEAAGLPTYRELIARTRSGVLAAWGNCEVPITEHAPHHLRRINVNYAPAIASVKQKLAPDIFITRLAAPTDIATVKLAFDLQLWLRDGPDRTTVRLGYLPELFEPATAQRLVGQLVEVAGDMCKHPDHTI